MAFNNQHYQTVADAMAEAKRLAEMIETPIKREAALWALELAARELATALAQRHRGSYAFKQGKFLTAAGFPDA